MCPRLSNPLSAEISDANSYDYGGHPQREERISMYLGAMRLGNEQDEAKEVLLDMREAQIVEMTLQVQNQDKQITGIIEERDAAQQMVA
ncbi:hypothetical protein EJB05_50299, partial [Eragrostis curvula]